MRRQVLVTALVAAALLATSGSALAASPQGSDARGASLLSAVEGGSKKCADLSAADFEAIGEYTMGRMIGSPRSHEAMDRFMSAMMGAGSERRVHEAMGRRFAGCGTAGIPGGFGRMMGAINAMGMMGGGMMGGVSRGGGFDGSPGSMMGGYFGVRAGSDAGDDGPSAAAMIGMMAVLIGAVALALLWLRPRRRSPGGALHLLQQRFANGELTAEEYRDKKRLLEGGGSR